MLMTLNIHKDISGHYTARFSVGSNLIGSTSHNRISEAIAEYGNKPPLEEIIAFHIWYGVISIGTIGIYEMKTKAEDLAQELVRRSAAVYEMQDFA